MATFIDAISTKDALTANGAVTNRTSLNKCLDFFSIAGNHYVMSKEFWAAFGEDARTALRILFWSRDCRGGAGARKNFQAIMSDLQMSKPDIFKKVFPFIPYFGYWKDIYRLRPTSELVDFTAKVLINDQDHSLCAKYCPRKGQWFYELRKYLHMSPSEFRHFIVAKTQVVENYMCKNEWNLIDYSAVPSIAGNIYRGAFIKHDEERYRAYIADVLSGKKTINSSVLYPCDLYAAFERDHSKDSCDSIMAMWNNLPNYMEGCTDRIIPVCDVSGSMTGKPMQVSVSLGCYISERNEGPFKDAFITFSARPQLQYLKGDIITRFKQLCKADWGINTNLQAIFDLILNRAVECQLSESEMPTKILIISDMRFDIASMPQPQLQYCGRPTNFESTNYEEIKRKYDAAGYKLPGIIFWNVNGAAGNVPVTIRDFNTALVSGYSPAIMESVLKADVLTPMQIMDITINSDRYSVIDL